MINNYVSIDQVLDKIYRDLGINEEVNYSDAVEWIAEALNFIGAFSQYTSTVTNITIENYRAKLPCGFYRLSEAPMYNNQPMYYAGNHLFGNYWCDSCNIPTCCTEYNFYIKDGYFHTSVKEGEVCLPYIGIPVDDKGFPKIPDDPYYLKACTMYVTKMLDWQKWRKGQIPDKVKDDSQMQWDFYVQAARGSANMPSIEMLESIKNRLLQLIPRTNDYSNFFTKGKERRYLQ